MSRRPLKKSGKNKFAGYEYFELQDILPHAHDVFNKVGLCGVFSVFDNVASLQVYETDTGASISFQSPLVMAENAKGQAIQSLGSTHTYFRRYLWLMAMEITENDVIDAGDQPAKKSEAVSVTSVTTTAQPPSLTLNVVPNGGSITVKKAPSPIVGEAGDWQIKAPGVPTGGDVQGWLELIKISTNVLLDITANDEDVMKIFKKNKLLFDTVKATDAAFFKDLMVKFTQRKNMFIKEKA